MTAREQHPGDRRVDQPMPRESRNGPFSDEGRSHVDAAFAQRVAYFAVVAARDLDLGGGIGIAKPGQQILEVRSVRAQLAVRESERGLPSLGYATRPRLSAREAVVRLPGLH